MLTKVAKKHKIVNFLKIKEHVNFDNANSVEHLSKYFFTNGDPDLIANMTEGIRPR